MGHAIHDRYNPSKQLKVNDDGSIDVHIGTAFDFQIGAVEIKDGTNPDRVHVSSTNKLSIIEYPSDDLEGGGKVIVGTTAVETTFSGKPKSIIITADKDNTGVLYVGKSNVASTGANSLTFLEASDSVEIDYDNTSNPIYVVAGTTSQYFWKGALL